MVHIRKKITQPQKILLFQTHSSSNLNDFDLFFRHKSTFYLVFDFCEHDLAGLLSNSKVKFSPGEIKKVMQQLLNALYYIHR